MKRLSSLFVMMSIVLLTACNSELEMVHNDTYYGTQEDKLMEKPQEDEISLSSEIQNEETPNEETNEEKVESQTSLREELAKRTEEKKETKVTTEPTEKQKNETQATKPKPSNSKNENITTTKKPLVTQSETNLDWSKSINIISNEKIDREAKIRKLKTFRENYVSQVTSKEVQQFSKTIDSDFITGKFTDALDNEKVMLTYLFKAYIVEEKTTDKNRSIFMSNFQVFLEKLYLAPNTVTDNYLEEQIEKLYGLHLITK